MEWLLKQNLAIRTQYNWSLLNYIKRRSKAYEAIKLYAHTGLSVYKWQENLLNPIIGVDRKGLWVHQKFGYSIPRRNGKSEILYIIGLWGLHEGLNILHTAHRISTSHFSFEKLKRYEKMGYVEKEDFNSIKAKGQERIELLSTGGVIQFRTRMNNGGLGEGFDLLIIDEAQKYTMEQESALKYTVTDSDNPMTIMCGTPPTPVSKGLDLMAFHGINPRTKTASDVIGTNHFDSKVTQTVAFQAGKSNENMEAAVALIQGSEGTVTGVAMDTVFSSDLAQLTNGVNGPKLFPELAWGANPDSINGLASDVNITVSSGTSSPKDIAIVGDFQGMFKWGYAKQVMSEIIKYGDPDNSGKDLKGYNQIYIRADDFIGWGIIEPKHFARITKS